MNLMMNPLRFFFPVNRFTTSFSVTESRPTLSSIFLTRSALMDILYLSTIKFQGQYLWGRVLIYQGQLGDVVIQNPTHSKFPHCIQVKIHYNVHDDPTFLGHVVLHVNCLCKLFYYTGLQAFCQFVTFSLKRKIQAYLGSKKSLIFFLLSAKQPEFPSCRVFSAVEF